MSDKVYEFIAGTLADGLAVPMVGPTSFEVARHFVDTCHTVSEASISIAVLRLLEEEKIVVEGGGATALAAVLPGGPLHGKFKPGQKVILPLCGGNIDTTVLGRIIDRGLAADMRLIRFTATVRLHSPSRLHSAAAFLLILSIAFALSHRRLAIVRAALPSCPAFSPMWACPSKTSITNGLGCTVELTKSKSSVSSRPPARSMPISSWQSWPRTDMPSIRRDRALRQSAPLCKWLRSEKRSERNQKPHDQIAAAISICLLKVLI